MSCENVYDEIVTGGLSANCRDFNAHCTVPVFDDGTVWFDSTCFLSGAQLRRVGITQVTLTVRVSSSTGGQLDIRLAMDTGQEKRVTGYAKADVLQDGVHGLTEWMLSAVLRSEAVSVRQLMVRGAHVEACAHQLSKPWTAMIKLFNGYTQLLGKGEG